MRARFLAILFLAFAAPATAQAPAPTRVALIIGNANYAGYPALPNTQVDAGIVAGALRRAQFAVDVKNDLDGDGMRRALAAFRTKATGAKVALVYYAGHGMESGGKNYLLPTGAQLGAVEDLEFSAIEAGLIVQATAGAQARVIVLDACRNNPLAATMRGITRAAPQGLAQPRESVRGTLYMYSAAPGQLANDGPPGRGSPFARAFAQYILTPGLDLRRAAGEISEAVFRETGSQLPFQSSSLSGEEIVFVPQASVSAITSQPSEAQVTDFAAEAAAFEVANRLWSATGWREFLRAHPNGRNSALAREALASIERAAAPSRAAPPAVQPLDPLGAVRGAIAAISDQDWRAAEGSALIARVVAASSREALEQLAAAGNARAQSLAGRAYAFGLSGFPVNSNEANRLYRLAVAQGDARAQSLMADQLLIGRNVAKDPVEAERLYRLAVAQGNAEAQSGLGVMYERGEGNVRENDAEAVRLYRLAADQGGALGAANLGNMYLLGLGGLAQNDVEAVRWFQRAAAAGSYVGQGNLAYMYETGRGGLTADRNEAIRLYRLAAVGDDYARDALTRLGVTQQ
jgi:TPR repeat protein/uncharacterized caspase-like protein